MESLSKKKDRSLFIHVILLLFIMFITVASVLVFVIQNGSIDLYKIALKIVVLLIFAVSVFFIVNILLIYRIINEKKVNCIFLNFIEKSLRMIFPIMLIVSNVIKIDKNSLRRVFTEINNKIVKSTRINIAPNDVLIIVPHCLQKKSCKYKVAGSIKNCIKCGACNIADLINLCDKYGVNLEVVTGGTLARKIIADYKPKGIIAVACERDLSYGILDVKSIPVIGVTNIRPYGPCVNTCVDVDEVEKAIIFFTGRV
ncbi:DUF116 domain-containing protein [Caminicella sporogenes]|uniref:DUF116 domain-containing protein n=1 Tax=Caminicella sporogenes TaxID=166485 RepID=UPI002540AD37|nr:DUF116 domain-containing protein [Caminicella sporogenes]WIF94584.1 DUF116 domain-containing protein [Caminicella sporogenes]